MRFGLTLSAGRGCLAALCFLLAFAGAAAQARDLKFQALLVWATDAENSPDRTHKPVDAEVRKKLSELPLKWKNYFEVKRERFTVLTGGFEKATLSDKCGIEVRDINGKYIEVLLLGKGEPVLRRTQPLAKGEMLVLGGNAPDSTGWLVVLKRVE
jgi:hypothetical protein